MNKNIQIISTLFVAIAISLNSCDMGDDVPSEESSAPIEVTYGTMTDQDGNTYRTITVCGQTWMAENLRAVTYNDGMPIHLVTGNNEWASLTVGACCSYNNTSSTDTIATYGMLYNWYAVNTGKLAPIGWHVPSDDEWKQFEVALGLPEARANKQGWRGTRLGGKMKEAGTAHWRSPNLDATNESGFTALPGGYRYVDGPFINIERSGAWWTATEFVSAEYWVESWYRGLTFENNSAFRGQCPWGWGLSVRCVKD